MTGPGPDARDATVRVGGRDATPDKPGHVYVELGGTRLWWASIDDAQRTLFGIAGQLDLLRINPTT